MPLMSVQNKFKFPSVNLAGGLNTKHSPYHIADNESPDLMNVVLSETGAAGTREGISPFNGVSAGSYACDGLFSYKPKSGSQELLGVYNGDLIKIGAVSNSTLASSIFTPGEMVEFTQFQEIVFICNGTDTMYKYDGTDVTKWEIDTPAVSTITSGGAGTLTGDYTYKVAYVNSKEVGGELSAASNTYTASSEKCRVSLPVPSGSYHGITKRWVYRTKAGGSTFYYLTEINDIVTTTFDDDASDSTLISLAPTTHGQPPILRKTVAYGSRIFGFGNTQPQLAYYSNDTDPYNWYATNFLNTIKGGGDKIVDITKNLQILKEDSIFFLSVPDISDDTYWELRRSQTQAGGVSQRGTTDFEGFKGFVSQSNHQLDGIRIATEKGIETFSQASTYEGGVVTDLISDNVEPDILAINSTYKHQICAITYDNLALFAVPYGSAIVNDRIYVLDIRKRNVEGKIGVWTVFDGFTPTVFVEHDGKLYFGNSDTDGYVYELFDGTYNDDGSAIDSYLWTKQIGGLVDTEDYWKDFRKVMLTYDKPGAYEMGVEYLTDTGAGSAFTVALATGGGLWDVMKWDEDEWAGTAARATNTFPTPCSGRRMQMKFHNQNTVDQRFQVYALNYYMNIRGAR